MTAADRKYEYGRGINDLGVPEPTVSPTIRLAICNHDGEAAQSRELPYEHGLGLDARYRHPGFGNQC